MTATPQCEVSGALDHDQPAVHDSEQPLAGRSGL
ncbi:hypothetical protein ABH941_004647 [Streptacidiphilus sp. EB103A]